MFFAIRIGGVNFIVPAFVRNGKLCARINRGRMMAAAGIPETACVRWGF